MLRSPRAPDDSLVWLHRTQKSCYIPSYVYYCERIQVRISKRKGALREIQRKLGLSFQWSCTEPCLVLLAVRDNMCEGLSARDAHLNGCSQLLKTPASTVGTGENQKSHCWHKLSSQTGKHSPRPQAYRNTLLRQNMPGTQNSVHRSWRSAEGAVFLGNLQGLGNPDVLC